MNATEIQKTLRPFVTDKIGTKKIVDIPDLMEIFGLPKVVASIEKSPKKKFVDTMPILVFQRMRGGVINCFPTYASLHFGDVLAIENKEHGVSEFISLKDIYAIWQITGMRDICGRWNHEPLWRDDAE